MDEILINKEFDDCYFSSDSGYLESEYVFIRGNELSFDNFSTLCIGETGFGTGLNLLVLEDTIKDSGTENVTIEFSSVEKLPLSPDIIGFHLGLLNEVKKDSLNRHLSLYSDLYKRLKPGWNSCCSERSWGVLKFNLFIGDIMNSFFEYPVINDAWFFDGHSPDKNPEMWSLPLFREVSKVSHKGTTFATFTAAGIVKRGLREAGFVVKRKPGYGRKRHMISGWI